MRALVFQGRIVQIEPQEFPVAPSLEWIDIAGLTPQPEVGWFHNGVVFMAPPSPSPLVPDMDQAEALIRGDKTSLAIGRIITGNDALTLDAWVAMVRGKVP